MSRRSLASMKPLTTPTSLKPRSVSGVLQRKCACGASAGSGLSCTQCTNETALQRSLSGQTGPTAAPPVVDDVLRSPGRPLDAATRTFFEPRFGHDFGNVRVHADGKAADSARAVGAFAYTAHSDIVFGAGQYAPGTAAGQRLLAHELAHVVQQQGGENTGGFADLSSGRLAIGPSDSVAERQADSAAAAALNGGSATLSPQAAQIARQTEQPVAPAPNQNTQAAQNNGAQNGATAGCTPGAGISNSTCSAYAINSYWLPQAYVNNATCACKVTPNVPTANCVRKFLQDRLAAAPTSLKVAGASMKVIEATNPVLYQGFVQSALTPTIYKDHVDAYRSCCCPSGPAPYVDWVGVTSIPFQPCQLVGWFIERYGSCTGATDHW